MDSKMVPKLHPLLQNPPTKPSAPVISHSNSYSYSSGRQTKANPPRAQGQPRSRCNHNLTVPPDISPRAVITVPTSNSTMTTKVKMEQSYAKPMQAQPQAPLPQVQPLVSHRSTIYKPPS